MFYFFAGVLFFQGVYIFTQWQRYRKPEYLYYCFYLVSLVLYFFFIFYNDLFIATRVGNTILALVKEPTVLLTFLLYLLFGEHFIETYRYPDVQRILRSLKIITLFHMVITVITGFLLSYTLHFWYFLGMNIVLMILSLVVILRLMKLVQPLAIFILRGSLCAIAGTLLANVFNAVPVLSGGQRKMDEYFVMLPAVLGFLFESYYFLTGLIYKAFKTEEEITGKLISQLNENEKLLIEKQSMRNKIAQDLHDDIGASLSSIHIFSSVAEKEMNDNPGKTKSFLLQISQSSRHAMENMSDIVWAMGTDHSEEKSLSSRIKDFGYGLLTQQNIECSYQIDRQAETKMVEPEVRKNILLIIKEALNNIAKYSEASRAGVNIVTRDGSIFIEISDNGKGFDINNTRKGQGLKNMEHRAASLGGNCRIDTSPGTGTRLHFIIPLTIISNRPSIE
jgi:signal transduction histidine kinase